MPTRTQIRYVCAGGHAWYPAADASTLDGRNACPECGLPGETAGGNTLRQDPSAVLRTSDGTPLPDVPGYRLVREVGRGAMGIVYEAVHEKLRRTVALKLVLNHEFASPERKVRFLVEGEMLARLHHPNVVQIYEVGHRGDVPYFALEYVRGGTLSAVTANKPQKPAEVAALVAKLARGMEHAHAQGVVHRDLKPGNVLLDAAGTPKIGDFGLARPLEEGANVTASGAVVGTPAYMAPEQAAGNSRVGPAADVYGLGAILYECLTGRPPFQGGSIADVLRRVLHDEPLAPRRLWPEVPCDLEVICVKCLAKDPARRYPTAAALADELERYGRGEPIQARPIGTAERAWRWAKRNPAVAALLALLAVTFFGGAAGVTWKYREAESERQKAVYQARLADRNYGFARDALDRYLAGVNGNDKLREPGLGPLRKELLLTAREFYQRFADERQDAAALRAGLAGAYLKLAELARQIDNDYAESLRWAGLALAISDGPTERERAAEGHRQVALARADANEHAAAAAAWEASAAALAAADSEGLLVAARHEQAGSAHLSAKAYGRPDAARHWHGQAVAFHDALAADDEQREELDAFRAEADGVLAAAPGVPQSGAAELVADLDETAFRAWAEGCRARGRRVTLLSAFALGGQARFVAVAVPGSEPWELHLEPTRVGHQARVEQLKSRMTLAVNVQPYPTAGGTPGFASLWKPVAGSTLESFYSNMRPETARDRIARRRDVGARLTGLSGYRLDGAPRVSVLFGNDRGQPWDFVAATDDPDAAVTAARGKGMRPISLGRMPSGDGTAFALVFAGDPDAEAWDYVRGLTAEALKAEHAKRTAAGDRIDVLLGYEDAGAARYAVVWVREKAATR